MRINHQCDWIRDVLLIQLFLQFAEKVLPSMLSCAFVDHEVQLRKDIGDCTIDCHVGQAFGVDPMREWIVFLNPRLYNAHVAPCTPSGFIGKYDWLPLFQE